MAGATATSQAPITQTYIITPSPRPIGTLPSKPPTTKTPEPPTPTRTTVALPTRTIPPTPTQEIGSPPSLTPSPTPTQRPTATPEPLQHMRVNTTLPLNIRACAGTSCAIVDTAPPGTILAVTLGVEVADGFWWRKIDATGEWVAWYWIDDDTYYMEEYP